MSGLIVYDEGGIDVRIKDDGYDRDQVRIWVEDEESCHSAIKYLSPEEAIVLGQRILKAGLQARELQRIRSRDESLRRRMREEVAVPAYVDGPDSAVGLPDGLRCGERKA